MAALQCRVSSGSVAMVAATAKTVLQLIAPANQRVRLKSLNITFDGATSTATPAQIRLLRQTTAGTAGSTPTPVLIEKELTETIQTTAGANFSAEPTAGDVLDNKSISVFGGGYEIIFPYGDEPIIQGGGRLGVEVNAPATVNCRTNIQFEE